MTVPVNVWPTWARLRRVIGTVPWAKLSPGVVPNTSDSETSPGEDGVVVVTRNVVDCPEARVADAGRTVPPEVNDWEVSW